VQPNVLGWDIGGAHIKAVLVNDQVVIQVQQLACPLWKGITELSKCIDELGKNINFNDCIHAVTMTGELVDHFADRKQGVLAIIDELSNKLPSSKVFYYAGDNGFLHAQQAISKYEKLASANWLASAEYLALKQPSALFIDIGSTTTDIVLIDNHKVIHDGYTDKQRLIAKELVYCGVVRTPIFAISKSALVNGQQIPIINEYFSNLSDVYRLTGELPAHADLAETLDGRGKDVSSSAIRLARMFACDAKESELELWRDVAIQVRNAQVQLLKDVCRHHIMKKNISLTTPIIGAGVGRYLVCELAKQLGRKYIEFDNYLNYASQGNGYTTADCAPAASVACLASVGIDHLGNAE
jgi:probable H4MPT-linked C1 transfer pathway protein